MSRMRTLILGCLVAVASVGVASAQTFQRKGTAVQMCDPGANAADGQYLILGNLGAPAP